MNKSQLSTWMYPILFGCVVWNIFTTISGTSGLMNYSFGGFVFAIITVCIINFLYLRTDLVLRYISIESDGKISDDEELSELEKNVIARRAFILVWGSCSFYDYYTTVAGTIAAMGSGRLPFLAYPVILIGSGMIVGFSIYAMAVFNTSE